MNSHDRSRHYRRPGAAPLSDRDRAVVELVARFRQLERRQIGTLLFAGQASQTPLDRTLKRLVDRQYLARIRRMVGGDGGGSAQYVYQVGRAGWKLIGKPGRYWPYRSVNLHTLAIADCFVAFTAAERAGQVVVVAAFEPEPGCHLAVGGIKLTPDAYAELGYRDAGTKVALFLEVDRGTEHLTTIKDKCVRYWQAYQCWEGEVFPYVVFVVPGKERAREINRLVAAGPTDAQPLFMTCAANSFPQELRQMLQNRGDLP